MMPHIIGNIEDLEKVKKGATKFVIELKHLSYTKCLKRLHLHTFKYRNI